MNYGFTRTGPEIEAIHNTVTDPSTNQAFINAIGEIVTPKYTDIVYKASGGNSAIDNMIDGIPISSASGDVCLTNGTLWKRVSVSNPSVISDFEIISSTETFETTGGRDSFSLGYNISPGVEVKVKFSENSLQGSTLNGKDIKVLDIYNTEQSQWTINSGQDASKDLPKNKIYRTISEGMISEDVSYPIYFDESLDFWVIKVVKLYKHTFIKCGNGQEITELQDAFGYISQFDKGVAMDPTFLQSSANTDFYPNKAQISITLPAGTAVSPVTSVFTKFIRIGENDLNGVEIINDTRYSSNQPPEACVAEYGGSLDSDNLAFLTVWKSNLGEVRGITWKFTGEFDGDNQGVVRYQRTESRFKNCIIDVSSATFSSPSLNNVVGFYCDRPMENFGNKFIGPAADQPISAIDVAGGLTGDWEVSGRPKFVISHRLDVIAAGINVTGNPENMFFPKGQTSVYLSGSSSNINATNLNFQSIPFDLYMENNVTVVPSQWQRYKNVWTQIGRQFIVESTQNSQIIAQTPDGSAARFGVAPNGSVNAGVGNYASTNSLEFSGDGSTRHWQITSPGVLQPGADNTYAFGSAGRRPTELFAVTDVINTSDANLKTELREMSESEYNVGIELADNIGVYQWLDMVKKKGDGAREHVGLTVQYAISVMEKHGLDPFKKAFICFDEWEDLTESVMIDGEEIVTFTPSGQRYSFRYTQLAMLMISAISKRQRDILQRLDKAGL